MPRCLGIAHCQKCDSYPCKFRKRLTWVWSDQLKVMKDHMEQVLSNNKIVMEITPCNYKITAYLPVGELIVGGDRVPKIPENASEDLQMVIRSLQVIAERAMEAI